MPVVKTLIESNVTTFEQLSHMVLKTLEENPDAVDARMDFVESAQELEDPMFADFLTPEKQKIQGAEAKQIRHVMNIEAKQMDQNSESKHGGQGTEAKQEGQNAEAEQDDEYAQVPVDDDEPDVVFSRMNVDVDDEVCEAKAKRPRRTDDVEAHVMDSVSFDCQQIDTTESWFRKCNENENVVPNAAENASPSSRGRNATALAIAKPIATLDARISFKEADHAYYIDGMLFKGPSVTELISRSFAGEKFDGPEIIQRYLPQWRTNAMHKYHDVVKELNDEDATAAILNAWEATRTLGTLLHKTAELMLNDECQEVPPEVAIEVHQFERFMKHHPFLTPFRTELSLFYVARSEVVACGQADAIFQHVDMKDTWIVDFKRTDKNLSPEANDFGKPGVGPMSGYPGNDFNKYSLQQSMYAVMAAQHGIRVDRCFLLQVHPSLESYILHECADFREEARQILDSLNMSDSN